MPDVIEALTERYFAERGADENFQSWVKALGRKEIKAMLQPFMKLPSFEENPGYFSDWGELARLYN